MGFVKCDECDRDISTCRVWKCVLFNISELCGCSDDLHCICFCEDCEVSKPTFVSGCFNCGIIINSDEFIIDEYVRYVKYEQYHEQIYVNKMVCSPECHEETCDEMPLIKPKRKCSLYGYQVICA